MIRQAALALLYWTLGITATLGNKWAVRQATAVQRRYPKAFASRLAERTWYPSAIRIGGVILLLFAAFLTAKIVFQILEGVRVQ